MSDNSHLKGDFDKAILLLMLIKDACGYRRSIEKACGYPKEYGNDGEILEHIGIFLEANKDTVDIIKMAIENMKKVK